MASWYNFSMKKQSKTELNKMKKSFQTGKILKLYNDSISPYSD